MKKKNVIKKEQTVDNLLQQLRESQGPGDALVEINSSNSRVTTEKDSYGFGEDDSTAEIPEEIMTLMRNYYTEFFRLEKLYGRPTMFRAHLKVYDELPSIFK